MLNLLVGVTFVHLASQKFSSKRHALVTQVNFQCLLIAIYISSVRVYTLDTIFHLRLYRPQVDHRRLRSRYIKNMVNFEVSKNESARKSMLANLRQCIIVGQVIHLIQMSRLRVASFDTL